MYSSTAIECLIFVGVLPLPLPGLSNTNRQKKPRRVPDHRVDNPYNQNRRVGVPRAFIEHSTGSANNYDQQATSCRAHLETIEENTDLL